MEREAAELRAEIDRLSTKLASMDGQSPVKTASRTILAEIDELEEQIASMSAADEDDEEVVTAADEEGDEEVTAADDDGDEEEEITAADEDEVPALDDGGEVTASLAAPGIEDEITQDKFSEVEKTRHGEELTSGPSVRSVAPTRYAARLKEASARLDRVAEYLERHGRKELAFRVDKIADVIDNHLKQAKEA